MLDIECIASALDALGQKYTRIENGYHLSNNATIMVINGKTEIKYRERDEYMDIAINKFIQELTKTYVKKLNEKIERLKLEEARIKEKSALEIFSETERKQREKEIEMERVKLESIKRKEEIALKRKIEEKAAKLKEKAAQLGYRISEEVKGKERIFVLIRR